MNVVESSVIKGLFHITLDTLEDDRGSFREVWQREKMVAQGLPDFTPVQQNISVSKKGVLRGIHMEPWEKYVHAVSGEAFAAYVDLRPESPTYRKVEEVQLTENNVVFVPLGVGNSFMALSERVHYSYLATAHWKPGGEGYILINPYDPEFAVNWPLPKEEHILSDKDKTHPTYAEFLAK